MTELARAYWKYNGRNCHVYILQRYQQATIDRGIIEMAAVKLTKSSQEKYDVEVSNLEFQKPKTRKVRQP